MKKTYYQTNILYQLFVNLFLIVFILCQIVAFELFVFPETETDMLVFGITIKDKIVQFVLLEISSILILRVFIRFEHNNIHIKNNTIWMNDDWNFKEAKIQFKTSVEIKQIKSIKIIWSLKDSKLKRIPGGTVGNMLPKPYLSFLTINGERKNMFILYMSKKTVRRLIEDIKSLMIKNENFNPIAETDAILSKFTFRKNPSKNAK